MRFSFFLFIFCFQFLKSFSQNSLVLTDLNDCINCQSNLTEYFNDNKSLNHNLIFENKYFIDSIDIVTLFNLKNIDCQLIFSDSIFNKHKGKSLGSKIIYSNENGDEYSIPLRDYVKKDAITLGYELKCLSSINNYSLYKSYYPDYVVQYRMSLGKFLLQSLSDDYTQMYNADTSWLRDGYIALMGDGYLEYYNQMLDVIKYAPGANSSILGLDKDEDDMYVLYDVAVPVYDSVRDAVRISKKCIIRKYNLDNKQLVGNYPVQDDSLTLMNYYISLGAVHHRNDTMYLSVKHMEDVKYNTIARFTLENNRIYNFVGFVEDYLPDTYVKYNLTGLFNQHLFSSSLTTVAHSDYIYDMSDGVKYKLKLEEKDLANLAQMQRYMYSRGSTDSMHFYSIIDIMDRGQEFDVLYTKPSGGYYVSIFHKGQTDPFNELHLDIKSGDFSINLHPNSRRLLILKREEKCIQEIDY